MLSDDAGRRSRLSATLTEAGHQVEPGDLIQPQQEVNVTIPDLLVVDLVAHEDDGWRCCRWLRQDRRLSSVPILGIATLESLARVTPPALADDFVVDPPRAQELQARLRLLLLRRDGFTPEELLRAGDLVINRARYEVRYRGEPLDLTYKEYELLTHLVSQRGRVFTREALLNRVWGYNYYGGTRTVDVHVRRLRAKLGDEDESLVQTVRGVGYRFAT
ncbi:MAG: response regulator transcription factor [Chloroflexi bacterium]|nr:response regulator transcription factor [Chloroflexota bacterium]